MRNVTRRLFAVAFCVFGAVQLVSTASLKDKDRRQSLVPVGLQRQQDATSPVQRKTRAAAEEFFSVISDIARRGSRQTRAFENGGIPKGLILPPAIKLDGANTTIQLVLIPVPVASQQYAQSPQVNSIAPNFASIFNIRPSVTPLTVTIANIPVTSNQKETPQFNTQKPISNKPSSHSSQQPKPIIVDDLDYQYPKQLTTTPEPIYEDVFDFDIPDRDQPTTKRPQQTTEFMQNDSRFPNFPPVENSQQLLSQFRAQTPLTPWLPPVVTDPLVVNTANEEVVEVSVQEQAPSSTNGPSRNPKDIEQCRNTCKATSSFGRKLDNEATRNLPEPPRTPRIERSMMVEAILTVPSADYSEPYNLWWDAASGSSRIEHHGLHGTASSYRVVGKNNLIKSAHVRLDRTDESEVRRCMVQESREATLADRAIPILPDLRGFKFAGYIDVKSTSLGAKTVVERWVQTVTSKAGENGAVPGEILRHRHELIVARPLDELDSTPLRYAVVVDSSILGENCESYIHRFLKVNIRRYDSATFEFHEDKDDACDEIVKTNQTELVEPLREFSLLRRDPVYDEVFSRFKRTYNRQYADNLEEAVRKTVLIQKSRFVASGNRKGASFELDVNFLGDRLTDELKPLYGIDPSGNAGGEAFPYSRAQLRRLRGRLPQKFDWREYGGVTHVRFQGTCPACWAFTVVGAVEGALFASTGRLVALSEQVLLDCGRGYGIAGCKPTWPRQAYDYVRDNGLPALDEYPKYVAKPQTCKEDRVAPVARISSFVNVTSRDLYALKVAIRKNGPTVVLLDGMNPSITSYKKGFYFDAKCKTTSSNHAMLAVGWKMHRGETYFILKNSWSTAWGDNGYIYIRGKTNTCGMLRMPTYPVLQRNNVFRIPSSSRIGVTPMTTSY